MKYLMGFVAACAICAAMPRFLDCAKAQPATQPATRPVGGNSMSANAGCYVCHIPFVKDEISKTHLKNGVSCVQCHGTSEKHANDEDIGATKPDILYKRDQVNAMCRKCHEKHDVAPEKIVARLVERGTPKSPAVCTDCHGTHKIEK